MVDLKIVEDSPYWSASEFSIEVARNYSNFSRKAFENSYQYQAHFALYLSEIHSKGGDILEVGCGPGWLGIAIKNLCDKVKMTLTDHSAQMIQLAQENVQKERLENFSFSVQDATNLNFPTNTYGLVISQFMLRHISDPKKAILEAYRVLRPGGMLYFTDIISIDNEEKKTIIEQAPGFHGPLFLQAAVDSALTRDQLREIIASCKFPRWHLGFGGLGGFPFPSREILDLMKKGFPLKKLALQAQKSKWSHLIAPYWCHLYIYKE